MKTNLGQRDKGENINRHKKVTIIILNWNGLKDTLECIESVKKSDYKNFEIILVDNASTDKSAEIIKKEYPEVILIKNVRNLGFAGGNNVGIIRSLSNGSDYIWLLNNDAIVETNTLSHLVSGAEADLSIGLLSPVIYYYDSTETIQFCCHLFNLRNMKVRDIKSLDQLRKLGKAEISLWGTALLIRRTVVEKIGDLNESLFAYFEDSDYCIRAINAGYYNVVVQKAKIFHKGHFFNEGGDTNLPAHWFYYMTRNEFFFWRKHLIGSARVLLIPRYLSRVFKRIGNLKEIKRNDAIDACLQGLVSAFLGLQGVWDKNIKVPRVLREIVIIHPYLLSDLLLFKFANIGRRLFKVLRLYAES